MATGSHDDLFKGIYDRQYARLVRYVRLYNFSLDDARDLAQDAFARFYERIEQYRGEAEWGYLQKIARNLMSNTWRSRGAIKRTAHLVPLDDSLSDVQDTRPGPSEVVEAAHRQKLVHNAIRTLSPAQQQAVILWLAGFQYDEIAVMLRTTVDAVKSRLRDAKKALRELLGDQVPPLSPEDEP